MQKDSDYYTPAEDSIFFSNFIKTFKGENALDIGTGSGILAETLLDNFDFVVSTDINFLALQHAHKKIPNCICCNAADVFSNKFNLIVCNLPYLPSDNLVDVSVDGMQKGTQIPKIIIQSATSCLAKNGKILFLTSSLADYNELILFCKRQGLQTNIVSTKKLFYEELILVECTSN